MQRLGLHGAVDGGQLQLLQADLAVPALCGLVLHLPGDVPPALCSQLPVQGVQMQRAIFILQLAAQNVQRQTLLVQRTGFGIVHLQLPLPAPGAENTQQPIHWFFWCGGCVIGRHCGACLRLQLQCTMQASVRRLWPECPQINGFPLHVRSRKHLPLPGPYRSLQLQQRF